MPSPRLDIVIELLSHTKYVTYQMSFSGTSSLTSDTTSKPPITHLALSGSNLVLECDNSLGGVVVWKRGGEGGRVMAVGKMLVRRDGKGGT